MGSDSKHGKHKDVGSNCANVDVCPDLLIGAIAAAAAAAFYFIYVAITKAGRRRRKRHALAQDVVYKGN